MIDVHDITRRAAVQIIKQYGGYPTIIRTRDGHIMYRDKRLRENLIENILIRYLEEDINASNKATSRG